MEILPLNNINTEFPYPSLLNPNRTMRGPIVPVNEELTEFITSPPRPMFPNVQSQIGGGVAPTKPHMEYNVTEEVMKYNNSTEFMEFNNTS